MAPTTRPALGQDFDHEPVDDFVAELQAAIDTFDAARFDGRFAEDVLWGSSFGAVVDGYEQISAIHTEMFAAASATAGTSRYEVEHVRRPTEEIAIAFVRRWSSEHAAEEQPGRADAFDELALFVLVRRDGAWWLAAGQHVPDRRREVYGTTT